MSIGLHSNPVALEIATKHTPEGVHMLEPDISRNGDHPALR